MDRHENGQSLVRRFFLCARSILMRSYDSAVDHVALAVVFLCQLVEDALEYVLRENRVYTDCHEPYSAGKSLHGAPVRRIQSIASSMIR